MEGQRVVPWWGGGKGGSKAAQGFSAFTLRVKWGPPQELELRIDTASVSVASSWLLVGKRPQARPGWRQMESSSSLREEMLAQTHVVLVRRHQIQAGYLLKESQQDFLMEWVEGVRNKGGKMTSRFLAHTTGRGHYYLSLRRESLWLEKTSGEKGWA